MEYSKGDAFREAGEAKKARPVATDKAEPSIAPLSGYTKVVRIIQEWFLSGS